MGYLGTRKACDRFNVCGSARMAGIACGRSAALSELVQCRARHGALCKLGEVCPFVLLLFGFQMQSAAARRPASRGTLAAWSTAWSRASCRETFSPLASGVRVRQIDEPPFEFIFYGLTAGNQGTADRNDARCNGSIGREPVLCGALAERRLGIDRRRCDGRRA
jgi:hypothetical protein